MKNITEILKVLILASLVFIGVGVVQAWTGPATTPLPNTPPNNNAPAPINVSDVPQEKFGIFGSQGFYSLGTGWFSTSTRAAWPPANLTLGINGSIGAKKYCDDNGQNCKTINEMGNSTSTSSTFQDPMIAILNSWGYTNWPPRIVCTTTIGTVRPVIFYVSVLNEIYGGVENGVYFSDAGYVAYKKSNGNHTVNRYLSGGYTLENNGTIWNCPENLARDGRAVQD